MRRRLLLSVVALLPVAAVSVAAPAELFLVWGDGRWRGKLQVRHGRIVDLRAYSFEPHYGDRLDPRGTHSVTWATGVAGSVDGIHLFADLEADAELVLTINDDTVLRLTPDAFGEQAQSRLTPDAGPAWLVLGRGDPRRGPAQGERSIPLPPIYRAPAPQNPVTLDDGDTTVTGPVALQFTRTVPAPVRVRRFAKNDGRLYLGVDAGAEAALPDAEVRVTVRDRTVVSRPTAGMLWLALTPRIGRLPLRITMPGREQTEHAVPTTLVETRGSRLFLNGEPFLIKGTLPRDMTDEDGIFLKALGANTIRSREFARYAERFGFMADAVVHSGPPRFCERETSPTRARYEDGVAAYLDALAEYAPAAAASPRALFVQIGNEQIMGADPWAKRTGKIRPAERLDALLAHAYNCVKPLAPMLPVGYSNCAFGYTAPAYLDVYLHNTYLSKDRNWPPLEEFMTLQGCDQRPYIHTEFGANRYMPQACIGGANSPVLEKIHAWNYPHRWQEYLRAGTCGGTCYCMYDYDPATVTADSWDKGFTNFGIMTFERAPKLACWELWHLWRDFEIEPNTAGPNVRVSYKRDYHARNGRLTVRSGDQTRTYPLPDIAPRAQFTVPLKEPARAAQWQIDYTTHRGLTNIAMGAWPPEREKAMFLSLVEPRATGPFLRRLLDAEVLDAAARPAPPTLKEMQREDGVVPVLFRAVDGTVFMTVFTTKRPGSGLYARNVQVNVAVSGRVERVHEMSGEPLDTHVAAAATPQGGLILQGLDVPWINPSYGHRAREMVSLPVFRITSAEAARATAEAERLPDHEWSVLVPPTLAQTQAPPAPVRRVVNIFVVPGTGDDGRPTTLKPGAALRGFGELRSTAVADVKGALNYRAHVRSRWRAYAFSFEAASRGWVSLHVAGQYMYKPNVTDPVQREQLQRYVRVDDVSVVCDDGASVLANGDFESGTDKPEGWTLTRNARLDDDRETARSGKRSAIVSYHNPATQSFQVEAGKAYAVTAWYSASADD